MTILHALSLCSVVEDVNNFKLSFLLLDNEFQRSQRKNWTTVAIDLCLYMYIEWPLMKS